MSMRKYGRILQREVDGRLSWYSGGGQWASSPLRARRIRGEERSLLNDYPNAALVHLVGQDQVQRRLANERARAEVAERRALFSEQCRAKAILLIGTATTVTGNLLDEVIATLEGLRSE